MSRHLKYRLPCECLIDSSVSTTPTPLFPCLSDSLKGLHYVLNTDSIFFLVTHLLFPSTGVTFVYLAGRIVDEESLYLLKYFLLQKIVLLTFDTQSKRYLLRVYRLDPVHTNTTPSPVLTLSTRTGGNRTINLTRNNNRFV